MSTTHQRHSFHTMQACIVFPVVWTILDFADNAATKLGGFLFPQMTFTPTDGSAPQQYEIFNFEGRGGVGLAMYNTVASIEGFAKVRVAAVSWAELHSLVV